MHLDAEDSVAVWLQDPPIPGNPCRYDKKLVVPGSDKGFFNATTGRAPSVRNPLGPLPTLLNLTDSSDRLF